MNIQDLKVDQISQLIRDYRWMKNEINRLQRIVYGNTFPMKSWGVAQYGIDAAMPKSSKGKSVAEMDAMDACGRRSRFNG